MTGTLATATPDTTSAATAVSARTSRLTGVDATRGIALLGMMAVHSLYESNPDGSPTTAFAVFGGRAAAAFAVLAGVGIAFMTGRARVRRGAAGSTAAMLATRALLIGAIGLALGYTDARLGAVILPYYAVLFLLAIPVVFLPTWLVAGLGVAIAGGLPVLTHLWLPHLPKPTLDNPTLSDLLTHPVQLFSELSFTGEYPALPWLAYICAGVVIGRLGLARLRVALSLLGAGVVMAVGAAVASWVLLERYSGIVRIWEVQPGSPFTVEETRELLTLGGDGTAPVNTWWWLAVDSPHTGTPPDLLATTGSAVGLLGLMLLLGHLTKPVLRRIVAVVQAPLAAAGSMTLTLYTAHIMFINSSYDVYDAYIGYILQVIGVLLFGLAWRATAGRGPLESLVAFAANQVRLRVRRGRHSASTR